MSDHPDRSGSGRDEVAGEDTTDTTCPSLARGIGRAWVKPPFRNRGNSLGLEYPIIYGDLDGMWLAWDRHTGQIVLASQHVRPHEAHREVADRARPVSYLQSPFAYDDVA